MALLSVGMKINHEMNKTLYVYFEGFHASSFIKHNFQLQLIKDNLCHHKRGNNKKGKQAGTELCQDHSIFS